MSRVIAIDGPAAAGKGTLARAMAEALNFAYLDTGSLYRTVGLKAAAVKALDDAGAVAASLSPHDLNHPELRSPQAGTYASQVATQPNVRKALFDFQRSFGLHPPEGKAGAILDGRDIGTVIFPEADLKLFVTASPEVRAQRRYAELPAQTRPSLAEILAQVRARDAQDASRATAPMTVAPDAHILDTSDQDAAQVLNLALSLYADLG